MPIGMVQDPGVDLDRLDQGAASLPTAASDVYGNTFASAFDPRPALSYLQHVGRGISDAYAQQAGEAPVTPAKIPAAQANEQYGLPGYLRFNEDPYADDAAFLSAQAHERQFNDSVLARSNANPLLNFGAGLAGSLVNPANVGTMILTDGLAGAALEGVGARTAVTGLGRVANAVGEGALSQVPFVAQNYAVSQYEGEPYDAGDALRDIAAGAVLHTAVHASLRAASGLRGRLGGPAADPELTPAGVAPETLDAAPAPANAFEPNPAPAAGVPPDVDALPELSRQGAFAMAVDRMADDRPVDVGQYVGRELEPPTVDRLDETSAVPRIDSFRPVADDGAGDVAITTRGTEIPVRYGLAELDDLTTSHGDDLQVNPAYPAELQPRARDRAGAQARNYQLESELNPGLLMNDVGAGAGAPIVGPDGVVESGNGRTIALRRSAATGTPAYARYRAALEAQGFDTTGMDKPALVRMRTEPMTGSQRSALAREMNADVTERMGAGEQAMADAARLPDAAFDQIAENRGPTTSRDFARAFIARAAPDQANVLADKDGALSPEGERRIKAAVLARAYGDPGLVGQIFEGEDSDARKLGEAAAEAAPAWAKMRAAASSGAIPAELDVTEALRSAMDLVRFAAREGEPLGRFLAERLGQTDMFAGDAISPQTEAFLRMFYRDAEFTKPTAPAKIAAALRDYARQALEVKPGPDLFGATADEDTARQILGNVADKFQRGYAGPIDIRPPGRAAGDGEPKAPVIDLGRPGGERDGAGGGVSPDGERGAGGEGRPGNSGRPDGGEAASGDAAAGASTVRSILAADPELKVLAEDTYRLAAENGVTIETPDNQNPDTLAEAIRAAAVCLEGEGL